MGEVPGDRNVLADTTISFRVVVEQPGQRRFSYKYGPYAGWYHAIFDVGQVIGYSQAKGVPTACIRVEWFIGDKLIETKDLGNGPEEGTGTPTDEDPGRGSNQADADRDRHPQGGLSGVHQGSGSKQQDAGNSSWHGPSAASGGSDGASGSA